MAFHGGSPLRKDRAFPIPLGCHVAPKFPHSRTLCPLLEAAGVFTTENLGPLLAKDHSGRAHEIGVEILQVGTWRRRAGSAMYLLTNPFRTSTFRPLQRRDDKMNATHHFQARAQQRGISAVMVDLILDHGVPNGRGDMTLLGRKEIERAIQKRKQEIRELEKLHSSGGAGIAHCGETLVTAFHRHKKFKRD